MTAENGSASGEDQARIVVQMRQARFDSDLERMARGSDKTGSGHDVAVEFRFRWNGGAGKHWQLDYRQ